jgi:hypothetical protein
MKKSTFWQKIGHRMPKEWQYQKFIEGEESPSANTAV